MKIYIISKFLKRFRYSRGMLLFCCFFSYVVMVQPIYSQNDKTLNIYFKEKKNEKNLTLRYSVKGLTNYIYEPYIYKCKTQDNYLSIIIPDSITSFIMSIDSKPEYRWGKNVNIYIAEKETINIYLDTISVPRFDGSNASIHQFMFNLKDGTGNERITNTLTEYLNDRSPVSFFDFIDYKIKSDIQILDSVYNKEKINPQIYNYAKGIVIDDYLYRAGNIGCISSKDYLQKTDSASFFYDLDKLYKVYPSVYVDAIGIGTKASLRAMNLIPRTKLDLDLDYEFKPNSYLSKEEQERVAASDIIVNTSVGQLDSIRLVTKVSKFKNAFPNSKYILVLESLKISESKDYYFAHFSNKDGFSELGRMKVNNLTDITKMFLGGKPVFIDFWATWCAPCIKEFDSKDQIDVFLAENNIGIIYVSLDFGRNYTQWKGMIIDKQLEGFHYLATPEFGAEMPYFKEDSLIPRFVLIDKDGNVLIDKCELPSTGKLIPQIKEILHL